MFRRANSAFKTALTRACRSWSGGFIVTAWYIIVNHRYTRIKDISICINIIVKDMKTALAMTLEQYMDSRTLTHRRSRQQTRRILADLRLRWRDLPAPGFRMELGSMIDGDDRLVIPHPVVFARGR